MDPDRGGPAAQRGTAIHAFLQLCLERGRDTAVEVMEAATINGADEETQALVETCKAIEVSKLPAVQVGAFKAELTLAWNPDTEEVASFDTDPRLTLKADSERWVMARADIVALSQDGAEVYVGDYKTGYRVQARPADNLQVLAAAWIASRISVMLTTTPVFGSMPPRKVSSST